MKKIVSLMALCAVLFGAVLMATGCGSKPAKGSVWKVTTWSSKTEGVKDTVDVLKTYDRVHYCFHADGYVYQLSKEKKQTGDKAEPREQCSVAGGYLVKGKDLIWHGDKATISDKAKDTLTFTYTDKDKTTGKGTTYTLVMKASTDYKADEIKAKRNN